MNAPVEPGTARASAADSETLIDLVAQALTEMRSGRSIDVSALCAGREHLRGAIVEALALVRDVPMLAVPGDPLLRQRLGGRYRMLARIGAGAMGAVYRARDEDLQREVAVKVLQPGLFDSATASARLHREAEVLARLRHANIVGVHDRGRTDHGLAYVVMDLVPGTSLAAIAATASGVGGGSPVPGAFADDGWLRTLVPGASERGWLRQAVRWTAELGDALDAAHRAGVCHRDVKPSNVMVQADGRPVLLDFGIAASADDASMTATSTTLGTPCYMPPEAALGRTPARPVHDVWSLGATLFHLLTGRPPFEGDTASVLARLRTELPPAPHTLHPGLPRDLEAVVEHALQPDPAQRYQDAAAFATDLRAFLDHRPVSVRPLAWLARQWRQARRAPARPLAKLALLLLVSVAALAFVVDRQARIASARNRAQLMQTKISSIPALLALEGDPEQRLLEDLTERGEAIAHLDRILALGEDLPTRLLRAALYLDQGEHARAADDLRVVEQQEESEYLSAVAACYRGADPSARGVQAVRISGLPEPVSAIDKFVAGFHALRRRDGAAADKLLHEAGATYLPARDLRLLPQLMLAELARGEERRALAQAAHDDALVLIGIHGKTARTLHVIGAACLLQGRYADAVAPLEEALVLRPDRHGPHQNLGIALHRLGRLPEAQAHFDAALRLRPWLWNTLYHQAMVLTDRERFDEAIARAEQMPDTEGSKPAWMRRYACGHTEIRRALAKLRADDRAGARAAAAAAASHYRAAVQAGGSPERMQRLEAYAAALVEERFEDAVALFVPEAARDPTNPVQVMNVATLLRDESLDARGVAALRAFLAAQAVTMSPGRAEFEAFLDKQSRSR